MSEFHFDEHFIAEPVGVGRRGMFHIFTKSGSRSICGEYAILFMVESRCDPVTAETNWVKGRDCKACFRKAGLIE